METKQIPNEQTKIAMNEARSISRASFNIGQGLMDGFDLVKDIKMEQELASRRDRVVAQILDGLVACGVGVIAYLVAQVFNWSNIFIFLGWLFYLLICDGLPGGQSIGKKFTNSAVIDVKTGLPCKYWQSVVRNLSLLLLEIIDVIFVLGSQRRRLGDFIAGTKVIRLK
jgi:uncharacterized RDD family membrane protein YckC